MVKFSANLTMMFNEVDFPERFERAAKAGFKGVEYLFPYKWDKQQLAELLNKYGLEQVLHNLPAGDWLSGERGIACLMKPLVSSVWGSASKMAFNDFSDTSCSFPQYYFTVLRKACPNSYSVR